MFLSPLVLEADDSAPDFWTVRAPLVWCDSKYGRISVPTGFRTDLASIPRAFRNLPAFDPDGRSRRPAVVHDWLYAWQAFPKDTCDTFLRDSMLGEGCDHVDAESFYEAVHLFGNAAWASDGARGLPAAFESPVAYQAWLSVQS